MVQKVVKVGIVGVIAVLLASCLSKRVDQGANAATGVIDGKDFILRNAVYYEEDGFDRLVLSDLDDVCQAYGKGVVPPGSIVIEIPDLLRVKRESVNEGEVTATRFEDTCRTGYYLMESYSAKTSNLTLKIEDTDYGRLYGEIDVTWQDGSRIKGEFKAVECTTAPATKLDCGYSQ